MEITFDRNKILGRGSYGTVYFGIWSEKRVAVKRIKLIGVKRCEKQEALRKLNHQNVIKIYHAEDDKEFRNYAMELCQASLDKLFLGDEDQEKYSGPMPPKLDVLYQLAIGQEYIHEMGLIHRNIKPENVLIWVNPENEEVLMKWADFGLSKSINKNESFSMSGQWRAPEMLNIKSGTRRISFKSDVFVEGLVFGYFLLKGQHPFQFKNSKTETNIENLKLDNVKKMQPQYERDLILKMLTREPENRITSSDVVEELKQIRKKIHDDQTQLLLNFFKAETCPLKTVKETTNSIEETNKIIKGVDFNCVDENGMTPLLLLLQAKKKRSKNLFESLRLLMRNEVDVNCKDKYGDNALTLLSWSYKNENLIFIIRLLIENGIDVNCKDKYRNNALHLLCCNYKHENLIDIIRLLIESGIDVNCKNSNGKNALHLLRRYYDEENKDEIVKLLEQQLRSSFRK